MEQRIGSSSQPLKGAGFDPAFIPGLTSPVSGRREDVKPENTQPENAQPENAAVDHEVGPVEAEAAEAFEGPSADAGAAEAFERPSADAEAAEEEEAPNGPFFEASDRRAKIVADHKGVRLSLDDQACEFRWDEIGALETETPRFGKRFTITVHTPDRRWYPIEILATSRSRFREWESQLDGVLDVYFHDGAFESEGSEAKDGAADTGRRKGAGL